MKNLASSPNADPRSLAREWLVRLQDDDLSDDEIAEWETWIRSDPANRAAYDAAAALWATVGGAALHPPGARERTADAYTGAVTVRAWNRRRSRLRLVSALSLAAAVGLISVSGWTYWERTGVEPLEHLQTGIAQHEAATLSDGSRVQLAAMTVLDVEFVRRERHIALSRGQALFTVAHNKARPFIVDAGPARITAVGTAFDVHLIADEVAIEVTEGIVEVQPADAASGPIRVEAGRRLVTDGKRYAVATLDESLEGSSPWLSGRLEFRDQPLAAVLNDVNRYARTTIVLGDPSVGRLNFTGTVQLDAIEEWAVALPRVFPLGVERQAGKIVLKTRKSAAPLSPAGQPRS